MEKILKILLITSIFSVLFGPVLAIPGLSPGINIYLSDFFIGLIGIICLINIRSFKGLIFQNLTLNYFLLFTSVSLLSLILSPLNLTFNEKIISLLYLVRFSVYFSLFPSTIYLIRSKIITKDKIITLLIISGFLLAVFGWLQYFLYPDLRNLYYLGWDPHFKRIFGTLFDPNFLGLFLVMTLILHMQKKQSVTNWIWRGFLFVTLLFTYSRGSYLSLIVALFGYSILKRKIKVILFVILIFLFTLPLLPRPPGESAKLERMFSVTERLNNWREGFNLFLRYPVLGVGFNTVRFAKSEFGIIQDNLTESHSGAGFDNSFIFVLSTTGVIGLLSYLVLIGSIYRKMDVTCRVVILAIITHSMFVNSLFLPWVMTWLWILTGINGRDDYLV